MFLVLCSASDISAVWAYLQLKRALGDAIDIVTAEMLATALRWEHRITRGGVSTTIALADGRVIRSENIRGTLNRLQQVPQMFSGVAPGDFAYAAAEMNALFASWLHALPGRVWNAATPAGLSGSMWRQPSEWMMLACRAGFATAPRRLSNDLPPHDGRSLLVVGDRVFGDDASANPARALSRACNAPILGIALQADGAFHSATTHPDLRAGGRAAVDTLRTELFA